MSNLSSIAHIQFQTYSRLRKMIFLTQYLEKVLHLKENKKLYSVFVLLNRYYLQTKIQISFQISVQISSQTSTETSAQISN